MLVTHGKFGDNNIIEKTAQHVQKLFTQLYKFDTCVVSSLLGGTVLDENSSEYQKSKEMRNESNNVKH